MGWFLTLTSKMTGHRIPGEQRSEAHTDSYWKHGHWSPAGVGMAAGGGISLTREEVTRLLESMETLSDIMEVKTSWSRPQVMETCLSLSYSVSLPVLHPSGDVH